MRHSEGYYHGSYGPWHIVVVLGERGFEDLDCGLLGTRVRYLEARRRLETPENTAKPVQRCTCPVDLRRSG